MHIRIRTPECIRVPSKLTPQEKLPFRHGEPVASPVDGRRPARDITTTGSISERDVCQRSRRISTYAHTHREPVSLAFQPTETEQQLSSPAFFRSWSTLNYPLTGRYYTPPPPSTLYPPEVHEYNERFTTLLQNIKKRHDPTVTTVAQGVLEWKRKQGGGRIGQSIQEWLDRFYMSRIGIRFLIGQRESARSAESRMRGMGTDGRRRAEYVAAAPGLRRHHLHEGGECARLHREAS